MKNYEKSCFCKKKMVISTTLTLPNFASKNCSGTPRPNQNHQHISLNKLTGGYRKRLSGFRAASQNVTKMPQNSVHRIVPSKTRPGRLLLGRKGRTVSTSHIPSEMATAAPQGIEIASARKFCDFTAREGSPAAIFHENFEFSKFAPDLVHHKSSVK